MLMIVVEMILIFRDLTIFYKMINLENITIQIFRKEKPSGNGL